MFRIRGRRLYPSTLAERRLLLQLGSYPLYAPRGVSPYLLARKLSRAVAGEAPELHFVRDVLKRARKPKDGAEADAEQQHAAANSFAA